MAHRSILKAALTEVAKTGFRALTMDAIAARADVGKMTVYRRWPNKGAVVMDAFLALIGPATEFPEAPTAVESIRRQLRLQAAFFRGKYGKIIKALLGEAQFDRELADAFRDRWIKPRREMVLGVLQRAVAEGGLRADLDFETAIDLLYGPIYYRLQIGTGTIDEAFTDGVYASAMMGLGVSSTERS
jgi:AcrR family transcriptional regulator